ncbi:MAG: hypothetical protein ISR65_10330 [Bacteriovoracaceae bacterium]|nr:hypothetical protein [Bacteriovoracaceae bacterium]
MNDKTAKRKEVLINRKLQFTIVTFFYSIFFLTSLIFFLIFSYIFNKIIYASDSIGLQLTREARNYILNLHGDMEMIFFITFIVFTIAIITIGFLLTHKIAGPIYCMCRHLQQICEGKTTADVHFRKGDFFMELEENFNRHMAIYRQKLGIKPPEDPPSEST